MQKLAPPVPVIEVPNEGLVELLGKSVMVFCMNYIYVGVLDGINTNCLKLVGAKIAYETGAFTGKSYKDAQLVPGGVAYPMLSAIECVVPGME